MELNSRVPYKDLVNVIGLTRHSIHARIEEMEKAGIIIAFTTLVDRKKGKLDITDHLILDALVKYSRVPVTDICVAIGLSYAAVISRIKKWKARALLKNTLSSQTDMTLQLRQKVINVCLKLPL